MTHSDEPITHTPLPTFNVSRYRARRNTKWQSCKRTSLFVRHYIFVALLHGSHQWIMPMLRIPLSLYTLPDLNWCEVPETGREPLARSLLARDVVAVCCSAYLSAATGKQVAVPLIAAAATGLPEGVTSTLDLAERTPSYAITGSFKHFDTGRAGLRHRCANDRHAAVHRRSGRRSVGA